MVQGTAAIIIAGSHVWVEDPDVAWIDGQALNVNGQEIEIQTRNGKTIVAHVSNTYPKDMEAPASGVDDMTKLSYLHEPAVLNNLSIRYQDNEIYTYTGSILIAINPFQRMPHFYDHGTMEMYKGAPLGDLSPHIFAVADAAYRAMINEGRSNSILVSGESGAGKTETTKMLLRYLAFVGGRKDTDGRTIEQQVLESNPVLEAFGNAKTVKNNNSSRFGKFVELQFDRHGRISGAAIRTYLLERSRVCQISDPERNYHCFYLLCAAPPEEIEKFKLGEPNSFHYLNQSSCYELNGVSDAHEYLETRRAMDIVGISQIEQDAIFRVVAAILHLGNVEFATGEEIDTSVLRDEKSKFHLQTTAALLMCDIVALENALLKRVMVTPEEVIKRSLDPIGATISRDGLAKTLYSRLFDWLVDKINASIGQDPDSKSLIGVLDIYGFESFKINSFEQFCINYTNEKLQQHFNQHVFKMEQEEYKKDEIEWSYIEFIDNQDVLDLIEKKPGGIIALLDEACMFPKSTHETFSQKLYQIFQSHKRFIKPKLSRTNFTIDHYAGEVVYQSDLFLDKNKDYVVPEHQDLLSASKCPFVAGLFPPLPEETVKSLSKSSKFSSIGSRFKLQLQQLMETLNSTEPHYIRCVKPNNVLQPTIFENANVMQQLRCGGVLEAIRISCAGYPTRKTFFEFLFRFGLLAPEVLEETEDETVACQKILEKMGLAGYQIGKTKVFLRAGQLAYLDARRAHKLGHFAIGIQKNIRTFTIRKQYISMRKATICIQAFRRGKHARKLYKNMRREAASLKIQKYARSHFARVHYTRLQFSNLVLQTGLRAMAARNEVKYRKKRKAATVIQTHWRGYRSYSNYKKVKKASVVIQCIWRGRAARKEVRKLKMTTRGIGSANEACINVEKQIEELTRRLQLEERTRLDMEDAKDREIAILKLSLQRMRRKVDETNTLLDKEREIARKGTEEASSTGEEAKDQEIAILKLSLQRMRKRVDETNALLVKEREMARKGTEESSSAGEEAKDQELAILKLSLQRMRKRVDETNALLVKEREITRKYTEDTFSAGEEAKDEELAILKLSLQRLRKRVNETNALLAKEREMARKYTEDASSAGEEMKDQETAILKLSLQRMRRKNEEMNALLVKEREMARKFTEDASSALRETVQDSQKIEALRSEVKNLKVSLHLEKERADDCERRYAEALESSEDKRAKLEETERRVYQLQEMLNRMTYCMADQFSDLKMFLSTSPNSTSTSGLIGTNIQISGSPTSSDTTSTDSDFTFPYPASTSPSFSSLRPNTLQLIVQDQSVAEASGDEKWDSDKEGAFDDFF